MPTLDGTKRIKVQPGTQHGTLQRLRGEGAPKLKGSGPRRHPLPAARSTCRTSLTDEQRRAVDDLAAVLDGNPRERILGGGDG